MSLQHVEAIHRAQLLTVHRVDVDLDLRAADRPENTTFTSLTKIIFDCSQAGASTFLDFRGSSLDELWLNGERIAPQWEDGRIQLTNLARHNVLQVTGTMAFSDDGEGLHRHVDASDGLVYLYAMSFLDAAPRWFGCFDQPDLKARHSFTVRAPESWLVRGNTPATATAPGCWRLAPGQPLPSYLVTLVAGPWAEVTASHPSPTGPIELGLYARQSLADELHRDADELFRVTGQCFDAYHELFGVPYAFGDYRQVFAPDFNAGAMENPGCVILREQYLHRGEATRAQRASRAGTIAHELAHQWFGNLVTMRWWDELWLNESFAEYLGHRICSQATDFELWTDFGLSRKQWGSAADQAPSTHPVAGNGAADTTAALANYDGISYSKGAAVLRQLVSWMGEERFFAGLRAHFDAHAFGNATMADLAGAWQAQGVQGLDDWLRVWLGTTGLDVLRVVEHPLRLERTDTETPRPHALTVASFTPDGSERDSSFLHVDQDSTPLELAAEPGDLVLPDPDDQCWARLRPVLLGGELTDLALSAVASPTARVAVLGALRDAIRSAETDPGQVFGLLLREVPREKDDTILDAELSLAQECAAAFCPPAARAGRRARLAATVAALLGDSDPASDCHLIAQRALLACTDDRAVLQGMLDGETPRPLGPEDRWAAVQRLALLGADPAIITEEAARDGSSAGQLAARTARALIPSQQGKREALDVVLTSDASAYQISATARGLFPPEQHELTQPLAAEWFRRINQTTARRQGWGLTGTLRAGLPLAHADDQTLAAAEEALSTHDLDPTAERALRDGLDQLQRQNRSWRAYPAKAC
ncbi:aminopeptidase N [Luteococcus sp. H138]|uniref:aminopeptidase N n=1 Tax=unclassified Luteococcus TaxID=2639923 RepID=UPI00313AEB88